MATTRMFMVCSFVVVILLVALPRLTLAADWWESKQTDSATDAVEVDQKNGRVTAASRANWQDGYIEVMAGATADTRDTVNRAHAYSMATKTARHLAYEKLAETVNGINLYANATYDRELMVDANLKTMLRAMIRNARVLKEEKSQFSDGSIWVEVTLGMKLFGEDGLMKPTAEWRAQNQVKLSAVPAPVPLQKTSPAPTVAPVKKKYTGLVINAAGLGASPAMLPKIVSANGEILYGGGEIDRQYLVQHGLMGYQNDLAKASRLDRVGASPLIITAQSVSGKNKADFVVSDSDAALLKAAVSAHNFLKECRVVAVLN